MKHTRIFEGPVAPLGVPSADGRRLAFGSLSVRSRIQRMVEIDRKPTEVQLPLMGLEKPGPDHAGSRIIGQITRVWITSNWVHIKGTTEDSVPPGRHSCGIDLSQVTSELNWVDSPDAPVLEDDLRNDVHRAILQTVTRGRLIAVTLHLPGSTARPAFDRAGVQVR